MKVILLLTTFCLSHFANARVHESVVVDSQNYEWTSEKKFSFEKQNFIRPKGSSMVIVPNA